MVNLIHFVNNWLINMSYYAVARGRFPGVYFSWSDCKKQVDHFPGAKYKKFSSEREARDFVAGFQSKVPVVSSTCTTNQDNDQISDSIPNEKQSLPTDDMTEYENSALMSIQDQIIQLENKQINFEKEVKGEIAEIREKIKILNELVSKSDTKFLNEKKVESSIVTSNISCLKKAEKIFDEEFGLLKKTVLNLSSKIIDANNTDDTKKLRQKLKETLQEQTVPKPIGSRGLATSSSSSSPTPNCSSGKRKFSTCGNSEEETAKVLIKDHNSKVSSGPPFIVNDDGYVVVYTDGACEQNGKRGARAGIGVWFGDNHPLNISEPVVGKATNNMAEIQAATYAVETAKKAGVKKLLIHTDSKFLISCITQWINKWKKNDWHVAGGQPVKNKEELIVLDNKLQGIDVKWEHVRGHCGLHGNEMADELAREGAKQYMNFDCDEDF